MVDQAALPAQCTGSKNRQDRIRSPAPCRPAAHCPHWSGSRQTLPAWAQVHKHACPCQPHSACAPTPARQAPICLAA